MNAAIMSHCGDGCHLGCLITGRMLMECLIEAQPPRMKGKYAQINKDCAVSVCVFSLDQSEVKN